MSSKSPATFIAGDIRADKELYIVKHAGYAQVGLLLPVILPWPGVVFRHDPQHPPAGFWPTGCDPQTRAEAGKEPHRAGIFPGSSLPAGPGSFDLELPLQP